MKGEAKMETEGLTKEDIVRLVHEKNIKIINFCHIPEDGRLKTLSFPVENKKRLNEILELGERVDGSSLFSYIDPNKSDIYITPKAETAFINPFTAMPTLNILCEYLDENGKPLDIAPQNILSRAEEKLFSSTGVVLKALAELEFYIIYKPEETVFQQVSEKNYQETMPFIKFENLRNEVLTTLAEIGAPMKYGHAEVGGFRSKTGYVMEQHEIEFQPQNLCRIAENIVIAKWVIRNICAKYGVSVSFAPKLSLEHAGNGMHVHLCGLKDGRNILADSVGNLTNEAKQMIGGILNFAPSLTAFSNTLPVSYLRFVYRKESPMHICWGLRNRLALIRIPLWWSFRGTPQETNSLQRTFEFRAPDATANPHLLFAAITVAVEYGLKNPEKSLKIAEDLHVDETAKKRRRYRFLPKSCTESAKHLKKDRKYYEADGVFPKRVIDGIISKLESYKDRDLWKKLADKPKKIEELIQEYMHCG